MGVLHLEDFSTELRFELLEQGIDAGVVRPGGEGFNNSPELNSEVWH